MGDALTNPASTGIDGYIIRRMSADVSERIEVPVPPDDAYRAVSDVRRMTRWSTECFATWILSRRDGIAVRFVAFNRRGPYLWFTTCRVVTAAPGEEYAFDVTTMGLPVSRWGFRFSAVPSGTEVTEYWVDRRMKGSRILGRVFTGRVANHRPEANREAMRTTLARLAQELASAGRHAPPHVG
jgi:hypothetical protein